MIVPPGMRVIGLLGGVASGKSLVARLLAERGAGVLDADRAGHEALRLPQVIAAIRARWGDSVVAADGQIDRARLAKIVFAPPPDGPRERAALEKLTHPEIRRLIVAQAEAYAAAGVRVCVLDAPLLLEAGWDAWCDVLVFVEANWAVRCVRAAARGWSEAELRARQSVQRSVEEKRTRADFVVDNSATPEETRVQIDDFWRRWVCGEKAESGKRKAEEGGENTDPIDRQREVGN